MITPRPTDGVSRQAGLLVLLRNNLLVSMLVFAALEGWRHYYFLTDDNLDFEFPFFTEMGHHLLGGRSPFVSDHLFGGGYNLLRDPCFFNWHPLYLIVSLLAGTPFRNMIIDVDAFFLVMLATAGFVALADFLRREKLAVLGDGWIMFYAISYSYSMIVVTTGASWVNYLGNVSALPWLALGILQKEWRPGIGLVTLFVLHQTLGGHLEPTVSSSIYLSLFALGITVCRRSWLPLGNWLAGYVVAMVVILPLLLPMIEGFSESHREQGLALKIMQANAIPVPMFPVSLFMGSAVWILNPYDSSHVTLPLAVGAASAAWCLVPALAGGTKWRGLEVVTLLMMIFGAVLICRPVWITEIIMRLPVLRSMRMPFREFVEFQFFLHLFLLVRPPGLTVKIRRMVALLSACFFVVFLGCSWPPTFNPMDRDRELILTGGDQRYWEQVRSFLKPTDCLAVIIPEDGYADIGYSGPFSLLGSYDYAQLADVVNVSGYSQTFPRDQVPIKTVPYYFFGAFLPEQKAALVAERPDLKFMTLVSTHPLRMTLSSANGPTIDLTPFIPAGIMDWDQPQ